MAKIFYTLSQSPPMNTDFLSEPEQQKLTSMRFAKRRREWLQGRWTAKRLLLAADPTCVGLPFSDITIENEMGGAPYFTFAGLGRYLGCISISHRENMAFCALCMEEEVNVGADMEWIEPRTPAFVKDYLTKLEVSIANSLQAKDRDRWVALSWSAKEAVLKAMRIGLRVDTRSIEVLEKPELDHWVELPMWIDLPDVEGMRVWGKLEGNYVLTLAAIGGVGEYEMVNLTEWLVG